MRCGCCFMVVLGLVFSVASGQDLTSEPQYESVYAPPEPMMPGQGTNMGGVTLDMTVSYMTDYVFRGIDQGEAAAGVRIENDVVVIDTDAGKEDAPNLQLNTELEFDLGKSPHPFIGVFVNVYDADPESRFQEIRPFVGLELTARPIILDVGHNTFIYPDRDDLNTGEVWGRITLDDSYFLRTDDPVLSPYVLAAYDYDLYDGLYTEAGVEHKIEMDSLGMVFTLQASIAYVSDHAQFMVPGMTEETGLQHYRFGLIADYEMNTLLNIPRRFGNWSFIGYMFYTDGIENDLRSDTQLWGGAGVGFRY